MKIQINSFKVEISKKGISLKKLISERYQIFEENIYEIIVTKESIDARDKENIFLVYTLIVDINERAYPKVQSNKFITKYEDEEVKLNYPKWNHPYQPVIVGFGPSGIFAALYLARCNAKPIIIERGSAIETRIKEVENFLRNKKLNTNSNIQFGEGGAGTFSDGKLTTNIKDPLIKFILQEFVNHGAPKEILYEAMPHIGTDFLRNVVKNIREEIKELKGEFYFNHQFIDYKKENDLIKVNVAGDTLKELTTKHLLLGFGHSARDTIKMLHEKGINLEPKSFSMGVRIEHDKTTINRIQYGKHHKELSPASYKLAVHLKDRSVYTFCMCPGGQVMASQSEENTILTNGMSYRNRNKENSNSALLVNVDPSDYMQNSVLDGLYFQEKYEKLAFDISGDYKAPANLVKEFLSNKIATEVRSVKPSYPHGIVFADLRRCLPMFVVRSLKDAIPLFDKKMQGFMDNDAILVGIETRSSCPIRVLREDDRQSSEKGIYPIGEGAGYAGGITSAAVDGLKTALSILNK